MSAFPQMSEPPPTISIELVSQTKCEPARAGVPTSVALKPSIEPVRSMLPMALPLRSITFITFKAKVGPTGVNRVRMTECPSGRRVTDIGLLPSTM